jgi:3-dehydroquinate synthetase
VSSKDALAAIGHDKKVVAGTLHFVAATERGKTTTLTDVTAKELKAALRSLGLRP